MKGWESRDLKIAYDVGQMEDDVVIKDLYARTFHGFVYKSEEGKLQNYFDAQKTIVWEKKAALEQRHILTTPIWSKSYWFDSLSKLPANRAAYQEVFTTLLDEEYFSLLQEIAALPSAIPETTFKLQLKELEENGTPAEVKDLEHYGYRWHVLS